MRKVRILKNENGRTAFTLLQDSNHRLWLENPEGVQITVDDFMEQMEEIMNRHASELPEIDPDEDPEDGDSVIVGIDYLLEQIEEGRRSLEWQRA